MSRIHPSPSPDVHHDLSSQRSALLGGQAVLTPMDREGPRDVSGSTGRHQGIDARSAASTGVSDEYVMVDGELYSCIHHVDRMPPFLMSVVSDSDLWLFVGSNTGMTAGRRNPDCAIFPYVTADKILHQPHASGVCTLIEAAGVLWAPWQGFAPADVTRNLYKHATGSRVLFEEIHHGLQLRFRWSLIPSGEFGLLRTCELEDLSSGGRQVRVLDGWHHILPAGVSQDTYSKYSYLAAAYMRHEYWQDRKLGVFTLNSGISDRAEPCESLSVSVAWCMGLGSSGVLLSDRQLASFRKGGEVVPEKEVRGEFGAYLVHAGIELKPGQTRKWTMAADIGLDHAALVRLRQRLADEARLREDVETEIGRSVEALRRRLAGADALQQTNDRAASVHHFANVLFNCMRGGALERGYHFEKQDFIAFLKSRNVEVAKAHESWVASLDGDATLPALRAAAEVQGDPQLARLAREYLPVSFSRRHGDPSRPWNRFEIRIRGKDGRPVYAYSGNWRDIFQNWESLAHSYPVCFESMIAIFLNATTADGYNAYRINREGIDWEVHDPKDPWSHIGYWGDHQIVYLLKLLEGCERVNPGMLGGKLDERLYAYANVPYEIKGFEALAGDPRNSIVFNDARHEAWLALANALGGDGKLLGAETGEVFLVSLGEKLLVPVLAKLSNLVPGGGIWLNTQRPEWNDANNALAGWGLSVVTIGYLRRYLKFLERLFSHTTLPSLEVSVPLVRLMEEVAAALPAAAGALDDVTRWQIVKELGRAGESHRQAVYRREPFDAAHRGIEFFRDFIARGLEALDATLDANRREDGMFHSYNILALGGNAAKIRHLEVMLEGQVAALSSGMLDAKDALTLLDALRRSELYRPDQQSYLLYPDKEMVPFLRRNALPADWRARAPYLALRADTDHGVVSIDDEGNAHFSAVFQNARDLESSLRAEGAGEAAILDSLELWESVFHHHAFTGRSGAMFAFEGLGSIYWHMVAKLLLAIQELYFEASDREPASEEARRLAEAYQSVRSGLGFTKKAADYGAFPSDPYSHTPGHRGAQQPGMTGQAKEEILTRWGELGIRVREGRIHFEPRLLKRAEFFEVPHAFEFIGIDGALECWELPAGTLAFTLCQIPVSYAISDHPGIVVERTNGAIDAFEGSVLSLHDSNELFMRTGSIRRLRIELPATQYPFQ